MAAWDGRTGAESKPVCLRKTVPAPSRPASETPAGRPPTPAGRVAGQHRPILPFVRTRFGTGDFRLLPALLGVLAALLVVALIAGVAVGWPMLRDGRRHLALGQTVAGMARVADDGGASASVWESFTAGMPGLTNVVAGTYADPADEAKLFMVVAGERATWRPRRQAVTTMNALAGHDEPVDYDTGTLGGYIECASAHDDRYERTFCLWVDHGTTGFAVFYHRSMAESAALFGRVRREVTVR
jgi:hypothetical protein